MVYNIRRWPKERGTEKKYKKKKKKKIKKHITKGKTLDSRFNYFGYAEDNFYIPYS